MADYLITEGRMELILGRYRSDPALAARMTALPAAQFSVEAATMERFLTAVYDRFGGSEAWAVGAGVPVESIDRMRSLLLEPAGRPD